MSEIVVSLRALHQDMTASSGKSQSRMTCSWKAYDLV